MKKNCSGYFITGTDTGVGKTWSTVALMHYFKNRGKTVVGMKPVASGCQVMDGKLKNEDALLLQENASLKIQYDDVNPYAFELPVSPHLAAAIAGCSIEFDVIINKFEYLKRQAECVLVEGVGGWLVPLNANQNVADLAKRVDLPVVMVVAIRLGCINHAMLTYKAILSSGLPCVGWIASCTESEMQCREENITTIAKSIEAPLLGILPYTEQADFDQFARQFNLKKFSLFDLGQSEN